MNTRSILRVGALAAALGLALSVAIAATSATPASARTTTDETRSPSRVPHTTVTATLLDSMKIVLDQTTVPSGTVDFLVTNAGNIVHELVVLKTDQAAGSLPPDPTQPGKIVERLHMGETGDVQNGRFSGLELSLAAGKYVIVCDEPGHYGAGMYAPFTVTAPIVTAALFDNMSIWIDQPAVYAGPVTFRVTNFGSLTHEIVVLKSDRPWDQLPWDLSQPGKLDEATSVGETGDMNATSYGGIGMTLAPGSYWLVCNEPGHVSAGMRLPFTVLPDPVGDSN